MRYKDDAEQKLEQLFKRKSKEQEKLIPPSNVTVNLSQLSLPIFSGDPRQCRGRNHTSDYTLAKIVVLTRRQYVKGRLQSNRVRSNNRLEYSELDNESKYPIYLPNKGDLTKLIILHQYDKLYHAGIAHILPAIRFWIPKGRAAIKYTISSCMACKRWRAKPFNLPPMPNPPGSRVRRSRSFEQVGLDYLGPID
uniref:Integrase_H2C2 domain-containing protein n=1 Tax=Dracunculus medinensis TaxID=318479 RepID=A0A0N4UIK5_DRAME